MAFATAYHMEGYEPKQLLKLQKHHRREDRDRYDLEHCDPARIGLNEIIHGDHNWAENLVAEVETSKELNMLNEVAALRKRGRKKEADRRLIKGGQDPWKASGTHGPIRSIVLTADAEFFAQEGFEEFDGHEFRDPKKVLQFRDLAVAFLDKNIPREHCVFMSFELDERTPHMHAYYRAWNEKETKTKGVQRMLQPTDMMHFRNAEKAQDAVAEWFAPMGLVRGREIAKARREARARGEMPPEKAERTEPWQWRQSERMKLVSAEKKARASEAAEEKKRKAAVDERAAARQEREALSLAIRAEDQRREREERDHLARMQKADAERAERIKKEDAERAERDKALDAKAAEVEQKTGLLVSALREFENLGEAVKTAARKVGLVDHPLVQTSVRAIARMREMIGNLGGDQRQR
tara:strand:- start:395 stop:1624 length:1230 start_codon:yes stop_codon:yes gene_type:complete